MTLLALFTLNTTAAGEALIPDIIKDAFQPSAEFAGKKSSHRSPLLFADGRPVETSSDWTLRREEILKTWHHYMGEWPALLDKPQIKKGEPTQRDNFTQYPVVVPIAAQRSEKGYLMIPNGKGPFPAVFIPFYDPETSAGLEGKAHRDFAYQLAKKGFVTLSIGAPGGDARKPLLPDGAKCQPLSYLGYISANAWLALAELPEVDASRIGIMGHSYGGKWAMFGSCLWEKYACAVWSDPGIVFDETRKSINYWEPWYLGNEPGAVPKRGLITPQNPRGGAYKALVENGHDLHELHALMAPRPFLVSGGSEDFPSRWLALNHAIEVNALLGHKERVAMTNRELHSPDEHSNAQMVAFFEWCLNP